MKRIINTIIIICYLQLIVIPIFDYADAKESEMKIIKSEGEIITADKGNQHGIFENTVFDIKRYLGDELKYIGMALVTEVSDTSCCLKTYPLSFITIKKDDFLFLNERETKALEIKQTEGYWAYLAQKAQPALNNDLLFDGKILENPRIRLKSGKILSEKKYIVKRNEELLYKSFGEYRFVPLSDIESIKMSTKNYSLFGALIGTAVAGATVFLADGNKSIDTTYYYTDVYNSQDNYIGWTRMMRVTKKDDRLKKKYK